MITTYNTLSEKDKRLYLAVEAVKLPNGGISYLSKLVNCSRTIIHDGLKELKEPETNSMSGIRAKGGGRKQAIETIPGINKVFLRVIKDSTAGDPMDANIKWTNLSLKQISQKMADLGISVSITVVKKLLKKHGFKKRKALKNKTIGSCENRNEQFENINAIRKEYMQSDNPILSMDSKKKELLGNLYRDGYCYSTGYVEVYDHDFPHLADGIAIPHTLYDIKNNSALVNIGTSKDTSEFACDSIKIWWTTVGCCLYPNANSILILADGGGSNSSRHYIFKEDLQKLVDEIGIEIRMAHYPPYTSKWNPVEHRVFPHITRTLQGVILKSHEMIKTLIDRTTTKAGLNVISNIILKQYETGRKYAANFKKNMRIHFDEYLGQWNYRAVPETN
ncbi:MAG: ISAzo13 family transposase [Desulfosarcina sp.]|nr:ISAzo13 family transposase [Desulfobacterales bacterium]